MPNTVALENFTEKNPKGLAMKDITIQSPQKGFENVLYSMLGIGFALSPVNHLISLPKPPDHELATHIDEMKRVKLALEQSYESFQAIYRGYFNVCKTRSDTQPCGLLLEEKEDWVRNAGPCGNDRTGYGNLLTICQEAGRILAGI